MNPSLPAASGHCTLLQTEGNQGGVCAGRTGLDIALSPNWRLQAFAACLSEQLQQQQNACHTDSNRMCAGHEQKANSRGHASHIKSHGLQICPQIDQVVFDRHDE